MAISLDRSIVLVDLAMTRYSQECERLPNYILHHAIYDTFQLLGVQNKECRIRIVRWSISPGL